MGIDRDRIRSANDATYAAWNARDPDAVAAVFAADAELVDAGAPDPVRGREAIRARAVVVRDVNFWDVPGLLAQLSG